MADVSLTITATDAGAKRLLEDLRRSITGLQGATATQAVGANAAASALSGLASAATRLAGAYLSLRGLQQLFRGIVTETIEAETAQNRLTAVLKAAGGASGRTAQQIATLTAELAKSSIFNAHDIQNAAAALATFHNIQGQTFDDALRKIINIASLKGDIQGVAMQVARALNEPAEGLRGLTQLGITFSAAEKQMITTMVNANNIIGAQKIVMDALRRTFGDDIAGQVNTGLTGSTRGLKKAWDELLESFGRTEKFQGPLTKFFAMLTQGFENWAWSNQNSPEVRVAKLQIRIEQLNEALAEGRQNDYWSVLVQGAKDLGIQVGATDEDQRRALKTYLIMSQAQLSNEQSLIGVEGRREVLRQEGAKKSAALALKLDQIDRQSAIDAQAADERRRQRLRELDQFRKEMEREEEQRRAKAVQQELDDQDKVIDIQAALLRETGREADAVRVELVKEFGALRARLVAEGDVWSVQLLDKLINIKVAKAKLGELSTIIQTAETQLANRVSVIEARFQAGLISPAQRARELRDAYAEVIAVLELGAQKLVEFNTTQGTDDSRAELDKLRATIARLRGEVALLTNDWVRLAQEAKVSFEGDLRGALTSLLTTTDRVGTAFEKMANDIIEALRRVIAQMIATYIVSKLMEGISIAGLIGGGGGAKAPVGAGNMTFARGGAVFGPGSATSDSILARLSAGEYVVRAAAVDRYGLDLLDALNGLRLPPIAGRGLPGFALGGPVHGVGGDSLHSTLNATFTSLDPAGTAQLLRRQAGTLARIHMNTVKYSRVFRDRR